MIDPYERFPNRIDWVSIGDTNFKLRRPQSLTAAFLDRYKRIIEHRVDAGGKYNGTYCCNRCDVRCEDFLDVKQEEGGMSEVLTELWGKP